MAVSPRLTSIDWVRAWGPRGDSPHPPLLRRVGYLPPYADIYCEEGVVRVADPHEGEQGVAFSTRFAGSV